VEGEERSSFIVEAPPQREPLAIKAGELAVAVSDNSAFRDHHAGYNGITSLRHAACPQSPFVPAYAGVNFEFLFDGTRHSMAPRWGEDEHGSRLPTASGVKFSGVNRATVHFPGTPDWGVEAWVSYQAIAPQYVDVTVRIQAHERTFVHGYVGAFFASYIHAPAVREFRFWGKERRGAESGWVATQLPAERNRASYRYGNEPGSLTKDEFFFGGTSPAVFEKPVMFGRFRDMALAFFFDRGEGLRMAYCKDGGGDRNPAWDFAFLIPDYQPRRIYSRSLRLMFKPYVSDDDVIEEYDRWVSRGNEQGKF
jgi:hypothetical protein